eukprot:3640108-Amphidinium_carterae.1
MSDCPGHLGTAGWRVTHTRSNSARPEAPSADGGRGSSRNEQGVLDLDSLPLTPISELTLHREPYADATPNPLADIEPHPTFKEGRALNGS